MKVIGMLLKIEFLELNGNYNEAENHWCLLKFVNKKLLNSVII